MWGLAIVVVILIIAAIKATTIRMLELWIYGKREEKEMMDEESKKSKDRPLNEHTKTNQK